MRKVLIIDDDEGLARTVARIAAWAGFAAEETTSIEKFWAAYEAETPDVIVLDLNMGDVDGIEVLRALSNRGCRSSLLLVSGMAQRVLDAASRVGLDLGLRIAGTLTKPFRPAELKTALSRIAAVETAKATRPRADIGVTSGRIRDAIEADELQLELQPIVSHGSVASFEALLRWHHPVLGRVPPDIFIPVAESHQATIDALTLWVVRTAARMTLELKAHGYDLPIGINISGKNLNAPDFADLVLDELRLAGVSPNRLALELTESVAMSDVSRCVEILTRLRIRGGELAIDDFGTGFSSLRALRQLPFSVLKIDRSFVSDILTSSDAHAIVSASVALARSMGLRSVAEGVETREIAAKLAQIGVDAMQGYFFARPQTLDATLAWLGERNSPHASATDSRASA